MLDFSPVIDDRAFTSILNYKYTPGEYTYLDHKMGPYWAFVASLIPKVF